MITERLGNVCEFIIGQTIDNTQLSDTGIPVLRGVNIRHEDYHYVAWAEENSQQKKKLFISPKRRPEWDEYIYWEKDYPKEHLVFPGDLLIIITPVPKIRKWYGGVALLGKGIAKIKPSPSCHTDYLYHLLTYALDNIRDKTVFPSFEKLRNFKLPFPDIVSQERAATLLNKVQALVFKRRETIRYLEVLQQSVFNEMFGDPMYKPARYTIEKLSSLIKIQSSPSSVDKEAIFEQKNNQAAVLKLSAIKNGRFHPDQVTLLKQPAKGKELHYPKKGDLLMNQVITMNGKVQICMIDKDYPHIALSENMWKLLPNEHISPAFLFSVLQNKNVGNVVSSMSPGTSVSLRPIPKNRFGELLIPVPPISEQQRFEQRYQQLQAYKNKCEDSQEKLLLLQHSLCQQALKGALSFDAALDFERLLEGEYADFRRQYTPNILEIMLVHLDKREDNSKRFLDEGLYNKTKGFAFELLKEGILQQVYEQHNHIVKLKIK